MPIKTKFDLLKDRRTKIIATLGPASESDENIANLLDSGADLVRLNMSHGNYQTHQVAYQRVRDYAEKINTPVAILADLCGPKIRTGQFKDSSIHLDTGNRVTVTVRDVIGEPGLIPSQYEALAKDVQPGDRILLADGVMELRVEDIQDSEVFCRIIHGGILGDFKGINLPGVNVSTPALTEKDRLDARFALELGVDFLALSFVRRASDMLELRSLIEEVGREAGIIAKIEKPEALENGGEILDASDGIMIARGDLGVELDPEDVPVAQHQLIHRARAVNKPIIVATQMLESMMENPRPTRAEVTDISYAVSSGADAVMLSGETAAGAFPIKAVEMMARIVRQTEAYAWTRNETGESGRVMNPDQPVLYGDALAQATAKLTFDLPATAIVVVSQSGMSATTVSAARPGAPVIALTSSAQMCRRMNLLWGVIPILTEEAGSINPNQITRQIVKELKLAEPGQFILLVRGFSNEPLMNTPSVTVIQI